MSCVSRYIGFNLDQNSNDSREAPPINDQSCVVQLALLAHTKYMSSKIDQTSGTRHCVGQHSYAIGLHRRCWGCHASNPALPGPACLCFPPTPPTHPFLPSSSPSPHASTQLKHCQPSTKPYLPYTSLPPPREHEGDSFPEGLFFPRSQLISRANTRFDPPCAGLVTGAAAFGTASILNLNVDTPFMLRQPLSHLPVTTVLELDHGCKSY